MGLQYTEMRVCVRHIKFQFSFINFNLRILKKEEKKTLTWLCRYVEMPSAFASAVTLSLPHCAKWAQKQITNWWIFAKQSAWCYLLTDVSTSSVLLYAALSASDWIVRMCVCVSIADACQSFQQKKIFCAQSSITHVLYQMYTNAANNSARLLLLLLEKQKENWQMKKGGK